MVDVEMMNLCIVYCRERIHPCKHIQNFLLCQHKLVDIAVMAFTFINLCAKIRNNQLKKKKKRRENSNNQ